MTPAVSVLMPVRNAARTLLETLGSLAAQTCDDFELVVVDDGSDDGSAALVRAAWPSSRLRLLEPGRVGLVAALNLGLASCAAPYVARMDADDVAEPRRLELQLARLEAEPALGILATRVRCFGEPLGEGFARYEAWQNRLLTHDDIVREMFVESPLAHPSVMMRREVVEALGGYRDHGWPEDYDLWLRAAAAGVRFEKLPEVLLQWRDSPLRATRTDAVYKAERHWRCKAHHLARGPLNGQRTALWGAGPFGKRLGRELLEEGVRLVGYVDVDPNKIGRTRRGLPVVAPDELPRLAAERVVVAVGVPGARQLIRDHLVGAGLLEAKDFYCAA